MVRKFTPEVRLKKLINQPGGISVGAALGQASQNLDTIRDACMRAVDEKIEQLALFARAPDADRVAQLYRVSNEVFAEAGAFAMAELSLAAHSLCSLLAVAEKTRVPDSAILVHVEAMRALRKPDVAANKAARSAVLAGLREMTKRLAAQG